MKQNKGILTISVDDGHPDDLILADLFAKMQVMATFYIPTRNCEGLPVLQPKEISFLARQGFEVGGHTEDHVRLPQLAKKEQIRQIYENKRYLENIIGKSIISFCYPGGKHNRSVSRVVRDCGYRYARTCKYFINGMSGDKLLAGCSCICHTLPSYAHLSHALKEFNVLGLYGYLVHYRMKSKWNELANIAIEYASKNKGICHLYMHSYQLRASGGLQALECVLRFAQERGLVSVTNSSLLKIKG